MSEKHPYEAVGLRPDGDSFTVEVLAARPKMRGKGSPGTTPICAAFSEPLPRPVRAYRLEPLAEDQMQFISRVEPDHREAK
jgi:hypothetical protein